ncbi:hypothetical protein AOC36_02970 [Erysipelothrix larvae]|uniref:Carbohydrate kinase PfkB domain-containing protein n=1 Tax=Erysipelothrix larvae TaxID=1514105 RepID=A0A0X8GYW8_9FIRM|nr:carbohydrate kinase [Erysipelothrix larvae]AMC92979.1 hypothetical protein AOC36_02970 [Erysipelothrix larvae]
MIYSIGEMLIDLMQEGDAYVPYIGGAPANVACHIRRSNTPALFVGKISEDAFGSSMHQFLIDNDIYFPLTKSPHKTALALVSHTEGDRSFQFYRDRSSDLFLSIEDIDRIPFKPRDILHFCSLGLVPYETTLSAHLHAINKCKALGGIISFDVNLREKLWENVDLAYETVMKCIPLCDIIKVNEEELKWLCGTQDIKAGLKQLQTHQQLVICTMGKDGSITLTQDGTYIHTDSLNVPQVDTTGAGDSFIAMVLASLSNSHESFERWQHSTLPFALDYARQISARVVSQHGAIPDIDYEVKNFD